MYPTSDDPTYGIFVATQMQSVMELGAQVEIDFVNGRRGDWEYARAIWRVRSRARSGRFDLVHAHYGLTGFVAAFQNLPLVVSYCGDDLLGTPDGRGGTTAKSRFIVRMSRIAASRADGIICKSDELRQALPRAHDRARARVIGNGVDTKLFSPGDRTLARNRLGVGGDELIVLFPHSRRQSAVKRFDLAEAGMACLETSGGVRARLWIVNGVAPDAMADYYRAADCLLLTSDHEGSPNTVKEALCCDLPVVTVDVGDVQRWLSLAAGCEVVRRDPIAIAAGLSAVLGKRRRVNGAAARAQLDLSAVAEQVLSTYEQALLHRARTRTLAGE